ncbi:hypothetical protein [Actinophytocola sp.]|uniref:hypothetical protein n=1 Tax=Actinophytocola sp. TaxID=1872138 RepID=UPI00389A45DE
MSPRWRLAVLGGLFALVTACGNAGDGGTDDVASMSSASNAPSSAAQGDDDDYDKILAYARCMRQNGVDVKDPAPPKAGGGEAGGIGVSVDGPGDKEKVDKAHAKCKHLMPNGGEPEKPSAEDLDQARKIAKCLREHGIDVKDPTMENPGLDVDAGAGGNDPDKLDKAMKACQPAGAKTEQHASSGGGR